MTTTLFLRRAARWWPAPIALVVAVAQLQRSLFADDAMGVLALLGACGAFAVARAFPRTAFWAALVAAILGSLAPRTGWFPMLIALAAASVAMWGVESLRSRGWLTIPLMATIIAALAIAGSLRERVGGFDWLGPTDALFWGVFWGILAVLTWGATLAARAIVEAAGAESAKQQAVARTTVVESELRDERLRADLTHDFHDVMAHSLAVLAAQAEGLRLSHTQHPERIDPVLTTISDTARLALVEVRQLLERVDDDARRPQATSADIPGLVAQLRSAGPRVALHDIGAHGHLARLADIAAYRIVQESLTNALRHGGADIDIVVALTWTGPGLSLAVASPIHDRGALKPAGRGIAGMHERARLAGGTVEIDADGDSFVVSAYLPYEPISHEPTPPLTEEQLFTLPVQTQPRPEDVVAPWIVEATRLYEQRHPQSDRPAGDAQPTRAWSQATTVDLTPARLPDGRIRNPAAPDRAPQ
ncbi:sensor histidine kinase [Agrococcus sp. Ld7]|uniref:sensor histidine kinase n=1 Tax=Agrococcus sp. Ld7 TaxID=649148 RepID=UPI00386660BB